MTAESYLILICFLQIRNFEQLDTDEERIKYARDIYDQFIMRELLSQSHVCSYHTYTLSYKFAVCSDLVKKTNGANSLSKLLPTCNIPFRFDSD